ncbi:MAG: DUF1579 family protein [Phycisphaerae bacterium]|nr:DUF1579 family protein [Phycisphaerae bacterium]
MMKRSISFLAVALMAGSALAQDHKPAPAKAGQPPATPAKPAKPDAAQPPMDPMMEAWMKAGQPGPEHARFKMMEGTWDCAVKMYDPSNPSAEPQESKAVMVNRLVLDGRFIHHDYKGDMMGMPFVGAGTFGFNNVSKKYEVTWTDSMSTCIMFTTGTYDEATKTYTMTGEIDNPMGGKSKMRELIKIVDNNKHIMEMFSTDPGKEECRCMVITYTRSTKPMSSVPADKH